VLPFDFLGAILFDFLHENLNPQALDCMDSVIHILEGCGFLLEDVVFIFSFLHFFPQTHNLFKLSVQEWMNANMAEDRAQVIQACFSSIMINTSVKAARAGGAESLEHVKNIAN
jgi:hypothetical protein